MRTKTWGKKHPKNVSAESTRGRLPEQTTWSPVKTPLSCRGWCLPACGLLSCGGRGGIDCYPHNGRALASDSWTARITQHSEWKPSYSIRFMQQLNHMNGGAVQRNIICTLRTFHLRSHFKRCFSFTLHYRRAASNRKQNLYFWCTKTLSLPPPNICPFSIDAASITTNLYMGNKCIFY